MERISISQPVRDRLRSALVDERDLLAQVRQAQHQPIGGQPGSYRCSCDIAVRRPMDPETAEIKRIEVSIRQAGDQWLVVDVQGLGQPLAG